MSQKVRKISQNPHHSLYHYGLIRILIEDELVLRNEDWNNFLKQNGFILVDNIPIENKKSEEHLETEGIGQIDENQGTKNFFPSYPKKSRKRKLAQSVEETPIEKAPVGYKRITRSMKKFNDDQPIFHKDKELPVTIYLDLEEEEGIPDP